MLDIVIVALLILLNGAFALSELAVVSSRKVRLQVLAEKGVAGAKSAIVLAENPGRFLSTVQVGITLVGILIGVFSGPTLGAKVSALFAAIGIGPAISQAAGYILTIAVVTFLSVIVGELVPKQFALRNPERLACAVARPMQVLSRIAAPAVWLLDTTTQGIFKVLGISATSDQAISDEEIRTVLVEAGRAGVIEETEHEMIAGVMRLADRSIRAIMTPRTEIEMIDVSEDSGTTREKLIAAEHSSLPVYSGNRDTIVGVVVIRSAVEALMEKQGANLRELVRPAPVVPDTMRALTALERLREAETPMLLVHDEYGHFEGVVTPADILDAVAGAFRSDEGDQEEAVQREDGSWLLSGLMPVDEMAHLLSLPLPEKPAYNTVAGFVISEFGRIPRLGDCINSGNWRFEIVDMDGRRVDKVLASRTDAGETGS